MQMQAPHVELDTADPQDGCAELAVDEMTVRATAAAGFLKALSHEGRSDDLVPSVIGREIGHRTGTAVWKHDRRLSVSNWRACGLKGW